MTLARIYKLFSNGLEKAAELVSAAIIAGSALVICSEVLTRSLFGITFGVLEEGPQLIFCYAVLPMIGVLYKRGRHINVDTLYQHITGKKKALVMLAIDAGMITGSIVFLTAGISGTDAVYASGMRVVGAMDLPEYLVMLSIPIGGGILLLYSLESLVLNAIKAFAANPHRPGVEVRAVEINQPML